MNKNTKLIALTIDDGPNPPHTTDLLKILNRHGVRATFFTIGKLVKKYPDIARQIVEQGHTIGNHSLSHAVHKYITSPTFKHEMSATQEIIKQTTGKTPALYRSPLLFRHPLLNGTIKKLGLKHVSGIFFSRRELWQPNPKSMAKAALKRAKPGTIMIFHDGWNAWGGNRAQTVKAIDLIIPELKARGYTFVTADQMLGIKPYQD